MSASNPVMGQWSLDRARQVDWSTILTLQVAENRPRRKDSSVTEYLVAKVGNDLVGCVAGRYKGEVGYLYGLVVGRQWRRRGIGHALTDQCLAHLQSQSATKVFALAMFWNVHFFKRHDFVVTKRSTLSNLMYLHEDFREEWGRHSALLCKTF